MKSKVLFCLLTLDFHSPKSSEAICCNLLLRTCLMETAPFRVGKSALLCASPLDFFETFCRGTFRRAAASSLDTSFFNFRFFFNSDLDATKGSLAAAASFGVQLERCHQKIWLYIYMLTDIGKTVKAKWNPVKLELYKFILDIFVANCWFSNFLTQNVCLATSTADLSQESVSARPYKTRRKRGDHSDLSAS